MLQEVYLPIRFENTIIKVHTLIYGPKDAEKQILCLHGFASSGKVGFHNVAKYMKDYNLVVIDWIGYGKSSKPLREQDTYDDAYMISFLLKFIKTAIKKNILRKKFNIMATSMSGIAIGTAYHQLERYIEKIVLINPAGFDRRINLKFSLLLVNPLIRRVEFRKKVSKRILHGELFGWKQDQKKRLAKLLCSDEFTAYLRMVKAAIRPRGRIRDKYRCMDPEHINVPVLMLASHKDTLLRHQRYVKIAKQCRWKLVRIKYNDHALLIYRPKEVAREAKKFI